MGGTSSRVPDGFAEVSGDRVIAELQGRGASLDEALKLVEAALKVVDGRDCSHWYEGPPRLAVAAGNVVVSGSMSSSSRSSLSETQRHSAASRASLPELRDVALRAGPRAGRLLSQREVSDRTAEPYRRGLVG